MPGFAINAITATGAVTNAGTNQSWFVLNPGDTDVFLGVSGSYTGLTLQVQGTRGQGSGQTYYDIATYTTDQIGPLATPLAPADGSATAYIGDVRAFVQIKVTILAITGTANMEVLTGSFFPPRSGQLSTGAIVQLIGEMRAILSVLQGWLGYPNTQILSLPSQMIGSGVGGAFPNGN